MIIYKYEENCMLLAAIGTRKARAHPMFLMNNLSLYKASFLIDVIIDIHNVAIYNAFIELQYMNYIYVRIHNILVISV